MVGGFSSAIQARNCLLHGYGCPFPVLWLAAVSVGVIIVLWVLPFGLWCLLARCCFQL
jgi:hypothetical protein